MSIKYQDTFDKAKPARFDGLFDWDFLLPAFKGTKIEPMDIDAVVERKGYILVFETKNAGKEIPLGQQLTLETLIKIGKGRIQLIVIFCRPGGEVESVEEWVYKNNEVRKTPRTPCDKDYILSIVTAWFAMINGL